MSIGVRMTQQLQGRHRWLRGGLALALLAGAGSLQAQPVSWSVSFGSGGYGGVAVAVGAPVYAPVPVYAPAPAYPHAPVVYGPAPVVVAPPVVVRPLPVVVAPAPVVVRPAPVVVAPGRWPGYYGPVAYGRPVPYGQWRRAHGHPRVGYYGYY